MSDQRPDSSTSPATRLFLVAGLLSALLLTGLGPAAPSAAAAPPPTSMVDLGRASTYAVLSGASVGNTVSAPGAPHTTLRGDLGVKAAAEPTGFPPGVITGTKEVGTAAAAGAHADLVAAYTEVAGRPGGTPLAGALGGVRVSPGLHTITGAVSNTGTLTLDAGGDPDAVFVFQVGGALAMAAGSHVVLTNGARASRVFWQVNGAGAVGANADFAGTLMALDAVAIGNGTVLNGRAFARNGALTLDANDVYSAPPVATIDGGPVAITTDTTPTITGTTDIEAPAVVTVTIGEETLHATPSQGAWSVTSSILANGDYPVTASVTDGAGNAGGSTQQLTVDTVLPVVAIDGGAAASTSDATPGLSGTSDVAPGTVVRVSAGAGTRTALVQTDGTWDVTLRALADGTHTVTASVTDPAGNGGADDQQLTVDTVAPELTVAGGATALTNDATPTILGTADVAAGTPVTVDLADETLIGLADGEGAWSVTTSALSEGPHRVVVTVSDAVGHTTRRTQTLTVDTVAPRVAIDGGDTAATDDLGPTITGTSDASPGATVTVSIAGQTLTTLVQSDGTWNATPSPVGEGTWTVLASVPDPAGNVGRAAQALSVAVAAPVPPVDEPTPDEVEPVVPPGAVTPAPGPATPAPAQPAPASAPAPAPAPALPPVGGGATAPPLLTETIVSRPGTQAVTASSLRIATKVTAPSAGAVLAVATGAVRVKGRGRAIRLTTRRALVAAGQTATLSLAPKGGTRAARSALRTIRRAVKKGTVVRATITITLTDPAGATLRVSRTVRLTG